MTVKASLLFGSAKNRKGVVLHRTHRSLKNRRRITRGELHKRYIEHENFEKDQRRFRHRSRQLVNRDDVGTHELQW